MQLDIQRQTVLAKILLAPIGVAALLYWISQKRPIPTSADATLLTMGALIALLSIVPFALRLREVLKVIDFDISSITTTRILTQSMFYYFFIPLSVGTEVSKFAKLKNLDKNRSSSSIASAIVLDHIVGLTVLVGMSICLYLLIKPITVRIDSTTTALILVGGIAVFGALFVFLKSKPNIDFNEIRKKLSSRKTNLLLATVYSSIMHTLIAAAITVGAGHWQIDISYLEILFVLTGAFLFQMVPINFIGVGAIEVAGAGLYLAVGLSVSESLTLVSLLYCYRILIAFIGGVWEFVDACKEHSYARRG